MTRTQRERYLRHHSQQLKDWKRYAALALIDNSGTRMSPSMIQSQIEYHRKQLRLLHLPPALRRIHRQYRAIRFPKGKHYELIIPAIVDDQLFGAKP